MDQVGGDLVVNSIDGIRALKFISEHRRVIKAEFNGTAEVDGWRLARQGNVTILCPFAYVIVARQHHTLIQSSTHQRPRNAEKI